jgi:acetyltransferase-like isoleucine patch superfamily enzyme|tara:strand:+ start:176 stop:715 length:540 start_codon:yes stop_codon:yes gene_type:complete
MKILKKISFLCFALLNQINLHFKLRIIGNILDNLRMILLKVSGAQIGSNSFVHPKVMILNPENLKIGNNSAIGSNSEIFNYEEFSIGDNVDIGTQFYINTNNHKIDNPKKHLAYQGTVSKKIEIGSDIWIGARVTVLSGVKISDRTVIGAGAVVTKETESGNIYAGVPAKKIKKLISEK